MYPQKSPAAVKPYFTPNWFDPKRDGKETPAYDWRNLKVAFCFLADSKDGNIHPVWERFFERTKTDGLSFELLIHTKKSPTRFAEYVLPNSVNTTWKANVNAHSVLVKAAKERGVDKVVFLSETCIPLTTPVKIWQRLAQWDKTLLNHVRVLRKDQEKYFDYPFTFNDIWKAEQWAVVDKRHFYLYNLEALIASYKNSTADNEAFLFAALRQNNETENVVYFDKDEGSHYIKWPQSASPHPVHYYAPQEKAVLIRSINAVTKKRETDAKLIGTFTPKLIKDLQRTYLFARKFSHNIDLPTLIESIGL